MAGFAGLMAITNSFMAMEVTILEVFGYRQFRRCPVSRMKVMHILPIRAPTPLSTSGRSRS
jgi:hypothetical protein